jgi:hypothetical protein
MRDILAELTARRIVPVVVVDNLASALPLADALVAAELPVAEITFRTPAAIGAIRAIAGPGHDVRKRARSVRDRAVFHERLDGVGMPGISKYGVAMAQPPARHVGAHAPESNESDLHREVLLVRTWPGEG